MSKGTCVLCNSSDDLNTEMAVTLDDESKSRVSVVICDRCVDDATPRRVKEACLARQKQIDAVVAQARALGLELSVPSPAGLVVAQAVPPPPPKTEAARPRPPIPGVTPLLEGEDVISTSRVDSRHMVSRGGQAQYGQGTVSVPSHASHDVNSLQDKLPEHTRQGRVRLQVVPGRAGQPIQIPSLRQDGTGTTRIRIVQSSDQQLQARAKRLVLESSSDKMWERPSFQDGYRVEQSERPCPLCRGAGTVPGRADQLCPKCQGSGLILA